MSARLFEPYDEHADRPDPESSLDDIARTLAQEVGDIYIPAHGANSERLKLAARLLLGPDATVEARKVVEVGVHLLDDSEREREALAAAKQSAELRIGTVEASLSKARKEIEIRQQWIDGHADVKHEAVEADVARLGQVVDHLLKMLDAKAEEILTEDQLASLVIAQGLLGDEK